MFRTELHRCFRGTDGESESLSHEKQTFYNAVYSFLPCMFNRTKKVVPAVTVDIVFESKISRWFIFRFLWIPVIIVPFAIYGIWFGFLSFVHFFYMLVLGQRSRDIFDGQMNVVRYFARWQAYIRYFTNVRPEILI